MATQVSHDPFARTAVTRSIEYAPNKDCYWCGLKRKNGSLFRYYTETDDGRTHEHPGFFCSKSCHDSYNS